MKKTVSVLVCCLLVLGLFSACTPGSQSSSSQPPAPQASQESAPPASDAEAVKTYKIGYSTASLQDAFHKAMEFYLQEAAKAYGEKNGCKIELSFTVADNDVNKQQSDVMDLINAGNDAVMMCAIDSKTITSAVKAVQDAGKPALCLIRPADPESDISPDAFVGMDTVDQGYTTGAAVFEKMKADGVLESAKALNILGDLRDENAINRSTGFKKACEEYNVPIIAEIECEWDNDKTLQRATAALAENPEVNMVFCPSDSVIQGLQTAMERNNIWIPYGAEGHVYLGSQDCYPVGYELAKAKYIDANTNYDPVMISEKAIDLAVRLIDGKTLSEEDAEVWLKGGVMTAENCGTMPALWCRDYKG